MGGRGSSSGGSGYSKDGAVKISGETRHIERYAARGWSGGLGNDQVVLSATTDGNGNITLGYPKATGYRQQNSKASYAQYDLTAGITDRDAKGKYTDMESFGIKWNNVKSVSGQTYAVKSLLKKEGFKWDSANKRWKK